MGWYVFCVILWMSLIGSGMVFLVILLQKLLGATLSRWWSYYSWISVIVVLLIPAGMIHSDDFSLHYHQQQEQSGLEPPTAAVQANQADVQQMPEKGTVPVQNAGQPAVKQQTEKNGFVFDIDRIKAVIPLLWFGGVLLILIKRGAQAALFKKRMRMLSFLPEEKERKIFIQIKQETAMKRKADLRVFFGHNTPFITGIWHSVIYVPEGLQGEELQMVLRHELTHCRRRDLLYKGVFDCVQALHFFNPLLYWVRKQLEKACELSCDEAAIKNLDGVGRKTYSMAILSLVQKNRMHLNAGMAFCEKHSHLKERIECIMTQTPRTKKRGIAGIILFLVLAIGSTAFAAGISALNPVSPPKATYVTDDGNILWNYMVNGSYSDPVTSLAKDSAAVYTDFMGYTAFEASFTAVSDEAQAQIKAYEDAEDYDSAMAVYNNPANYTKFYQVKLTKVNRRYGGDLKSMEGMFTLTCNGEPVFENHTGYLTHLPPVALPYYRSNTQLNIDYEAEGKPCRLSMYFRFEEYKRESLQEHVRLWYDMDHSRDTKEVALGKVEASIDGKAVDSSLINDRLKSGTAENSSALIFYNIPMQRANITLQLGRGEYVFLRSGSKVQCDEDSIKGEFYLCNEIAAPYKMFEGTLSGLSGQAGNAATLTAKDGSVQASFEIVPKIHSLPLLKGIRLPEEFYTEGEDVFIGTPEEQDDFDKEEHDRLYKRIITDEEGKVIIVVPTENQSGDAVNMEKIEKMATGGYSVAYRWSNIGTVTAAGNAPTACVLQDELTWWVKAFITPDCIYGVPRNT